MIRAKDIIESVIQLNERNVINTNEIDGFVARMSSAHHVRDKQIHQWLQTTLRKYLINDYPSVGQATGEFIQTRREYQAPWVDQALVRGEKLYKVYLGGGLPQTIDHVIDYLTQAMDPPGDFPQDLKIRDLTRLSVPDAIEKSNDWTEWLQSRNIRGNAEAGEEEVLKLGNGFRVVRLTNEAALDLEGKLMQHCVGSYAEEVEEDRTSIYSLRDSSNKPHATFEIDPRFKEVSQIKGKQNAAPVEKYRGLCIDFLNYGLKKGFIKDIDATELQDSLESVLHKGQIYDYHAVPDEYHATEDLQQMYMYNGRPQYDDVKDALDRGADPNFRDNYWDNPLIVELKHNDVDIFELLLSHGADASILKDGLPRYVTSSRDIKFFTLTKKYMKPEDWKELCHSQDGADLLVAAVNSKRLDLLKFFLDSGVDPNQEDTNDLGNTPLKLAIEVFIEGRIGLEPIKLLLEGGADPDYVSKNGHTAYERGSMTHGEGILVFPELVALLDKYRR
jgi:hypothetical protein